VQSVEQLIPELAAKLRDRQWMLVTAESCTGGLIAKICTDLAGSSAWFERGLVTYSNQAKIDLLGVSEQALQRHGAVSEAVASEMAAGALAHSRAQIAVAVTGIAGPDGGSEAKPVGSVCFGFAMGQDVMCETRHFSGSRDAVRQQSARHAITRLLELLA
jgi:nicotinamide-nucleotide amidase